MSDPDRRVPRGLGPEHEAPVTGRFTIAERIQPHADVEPNRLDVTYELRSYEIPTLAEHAEMVQLDPLAGVPARGLARIMWAATKAGFRDAWARLRQHMER